MKMLHIRLLGCFSLTYDDTPLTSLNTPRLQAFFTFLILNRDKPQSRQHLAFIFWPESNEAQAHTNLRNLIHLMRQAFLDFDRFIYTDTQTIQWRSEAPFSLDVLEYERSLSVKPGFNLNREQLERAVDLYHGDLLPGCYEDWILPERERLHYAYLSALEALSTIAEEMRDYPAAMEYTRRVIQADPLHVSANHRLIRLYALNGDRPAALKTYQNFARLLQGELGIQPDREIQELYQALLAHKPDDKLPKLMPTVAPALVGRQQEWQRLLSAWKRASVGSPHMCFLLGEAGIGKSRLVEELVDWADRLEIRTAVANCYPSEGSLPYAPVAAWLRALPLPHLEELWLTEISRLLPEISQSHPKLPNPDLLTEAWQRQRFFEALARGVLGKQQKLLLVIEDLQWCDQDTLEWLNYLLHFTARAPLLILASVRWEEMVPGHPIQDFQNTITASGKSSLIEIKPLDQAESFQLANQVALQASRTSLDPGMAAHIYTQTEGNPLFIVETVRLGHPIQAEAPMTVQEASLSEKAKAVLNHRIAQLSQTTRELACLAATIGRQFSLDVLRQASRVAEEELVSGLDELLLRRIIREETSDHYDFSHDKLRETTFTGLSNAHRRLLHRRVAEACVKLSQNQSEARNGEIASHYERAGMALPAIQYYRQAARASANIFANSDAIQYLKRAISLTEAINPASTHAGVTFEDLALMHESLGELLALTGNYSQAYDHYNAALGQPYDQAPVWKSRLYRKMSSVQIALYHYPEAHAALDLAEQCLSGEAKSIEEHQEWIDLLIARAQMFYWRSNWREMDTILGKVQALIKIYGRDDQRLELLSIEYQYHLRLERYRLSPNTINLARNRQELCQATGDPTRLTYAEFQVGFALLWGGDPSAAQGYLRNALASAEKLGARTIQARCLTYLSIATRKLKQIEPLRSQTEDLLQLTEAIGDYAYLGVAWANKAWLSWCDGNMEQVMNFGQKAIDYWHEYQGSFVFYWLALWPMLAVANDQKNMELAESCAREMLNPEQQPLLEPLPAVLETALHEIEAGEDASALTNLKQAVEKAKLQGDL